MRKTVIPLLRHLPSGSVIQRCELCNELVFAGEICRSDEEAADCPSRDDLDLAVARARMIA